MSSNATIAINPDDALIQEPRDGVFRNQPDGTSQETTDRPELMQNQIDEEELRQRAYELWEQRGRPDGSPEQDWFRANEELRGAAEAR